jgi:transcriptional regulator with GAF, ATPase, and Fis domain
MPPISTRARTRLRCPPRIPQVRPRRPGATPLDTPPLDTPPLDTPLGGSPPLGVPPAPPHEVGLGHDLKERERELILATLRITGGSRKLAAERLGISPRTLRHKLQQLKASGVAVPRLHERELAAASP